MQHEYEIMANTTDFFPILLLLYNIEDGVLERAFLYMPLLLWMAYCVVLVFLIGALLAVSPQKWYFTQ